MTTPVNGPALTLLPWTGVARHAAEASNAKSAMADETLAPVLHRTIGRLKLTIASVARRAYASTSGASFTLRASAEFEGVSYDGGVFAQPQVPPIRGKPC